MTAQFGTFSAKLMKFLGSPRSGGTPGEYACDVARLSAEVIDEVLAELPEGARPRPETVLSWMPECESAREQTGVDSKD